MLDQRNSTEILQDILDIPGANAVVVVGRDGFVIEAVGAMLKFDLDTVGASVALVLNGTERMEQELNITAFQTLTLEANDAMIMCTPVGEALLVILAPDSKTLGMIRLQVKKYIPELTPLF